MKEKSNILLITGLLIALLFCMQQCQDAKRTYIANVNTMADSVQYYKNKLGSYTASVLTLQLTNKQLQQTIISKKNELKSISSAFTKVNSITQYKTLTRLDTIYIPYPDTIPLTFNQKGKLKTNWYNLNYTSTQKGIIIDSLSFPNTTSVIIGSRRKWFLGKENIATEITHTNPYMKTQQITSAINITPEPIHKKWYVWLGIGIATGLFTAK